MTDVQATIHFLITAEVLSIIGWPLANRIFNKFPDHGWGLSKIIGLVIISWFMWLLSSLRILNFNYDNLLLISFIVGTVLWIIFSHRLKISHIKKFILLVVIEEVIFLGAFTAWTYLRGYSPDINGLEKFMDYGFMLSILRTNHFPPLDHYLARETINYYYFGHYISAVMTLISRVPSAIGYSLQMSFIFSLALLQSFSLGAAFINYNYLAKVNFKRIIAGGVLAAVFVTLIGNLHTIVYWPSEGASYWYPDATRFIENTIHEFPIYSFVVNDLHGHVSDIPVVLMILGILAVIFIERTKANNLSYKNILSTDYLLRLFILGLFIGVTYATNAWDFAIYLVVTGFLIWISNSFIAKKNNHNLGISSLMWQWPTLISTSIECLILLTLSILLMAPFWIHLVPISQGIGIVPLGKQSPLWQIVILWGIQVPLAISFCVWIFRKYLTGTGLAKNLVQGASSLFGLNVVISETKNQKHDDSKHNEEIYIAENHYHSINVYLLILIIISIILIILPEIIFIRDIYPTHYRANTMFKFYYQAWIMLGIVCGYTIPLLWDYFQKNSSFWGRVYRLISLFMLACGLLYTYKSIDQGFGGLVVHRSIHGTRYLYDRYPDDAMAIEWINENITDQPTILNAVGDSYTDYAMVPANTGLPTVLGWPVHEWLWRGSYDKPLVPKSYVETKTGNPDTVAQRTTDVTLLYETSDLQIAQDLINKYEINYIYVGTQEREKYPKLNADKFLELNTELVYDKNNIRIYKVK